METRRRDYRMTIAPLSVLALVAQARTGRDDYRRGDRRCLRAARRDGGCDLAAQAQQGKVKARPRSLPRRKGNPVALKIMKA